MDQMLSALDRAFAHIDLRSRKLLDLLDDTVLFQKLAGDAPRSSCGECILRSAAAVEQTFGGITTRLWDDPFEWTLPEKLATVSAVSNYLDEVEGTRRKGFEYFTSDADLAKQMPSPEQLLPVIDLLLMTLYRAANYQGRAFAAYQILTGQKPPSI
jgi:hypothetical protein